MRLQVHRVVAGGEYFKDSALVDEEVIQKLKNSLLAPLHNPANAAGIRAFRNFCLILQVW